MDITLPSKWLLVGVSNKNSLHSSFTSAHWHVYAQTNTNMYIHTSTHNSSFWAEGKKRKLGGRYLIALFSYFLFFFPLPFSKDRKGHSFVDSNTFPYDVDQTLKVHRNNLL